MSEKIYLPLIYIAIGFIIYTIICKALNKVIHRRKAIGSPISKKKETTVLNLIRSIVRYLITIVIILIILDLYGVNTKSILASIGIAGAVIGLAFQDIVKNLLRGITIIFDNHYMQGDYVTINGFEGEVVSLGLQTTKVKSYSGEVYVISNSLINEVINHSMENYNLILKIPVEIDADIKEVEKILTNVGKKISLLPEVKKDLELKGIDEIDASNFYYRIEVLCKPYMYFSVKRELLKLVLEEFRKANISINPQKVNVITTK